MINHETIEKIKDAARIEEVIGDYVTLKKRGANHIGCCPFHNEKTPSFYVSPSKGIFKCFGCGESGDVVSFLMKHEHFTYPEALRNLAERYHIPIEEEALTEQQLEEKDHRDALYHVSEFAQKHFEHLLFDDEMGKAIGLAYFHKRGLSDETIRRFGLGYCLDEWDAFTRYALKNGYKQEVLVQTGLTILKEETGKMYDRFRGRVMFPIYSLSGRVLGFSGRILSSEKQSAKYVNSPDSEIYTKGNILYGIYQARSTIAKEDKCFLVEGNVDVISMHQSGITNCVASCGTALTTSQIKIIKRFTRNVTVLYDGDSAGIHATLKAVGLLFAEGMNVRTVLFPDGEDPDSYAQKYGSVALQQYLKEHEENFLMYRARLVSDEVQRDPMRKTELLREIVDMMALVENPLERSEYIKQCAYLFHSSEETLTHQVASAMSALAQRRWAEEQRQKNTNTSPTPNGMAAPTGLPQNTAGAPTAAPNAGTGVPTGAPIPPPDDLFLPSLPEGEIQEQNPVTNYVAPQQVLPSENPSEYQEIQIIQLLVSHGADYLDHVLDDEEGNPVACHDLVADLIVTDLDADGITFLNPTAGRIFDIYRTRLCNNEPMPDANYFARCNDHEVSRMALSMLVSPYAISDKWGTKYGVFTPTEEDRLERNITESVLNLKIKKIDEQIAELDHTLRDPNLDEIDMMLTLQKKKQITDIRCQLGEALHRVIG